LAGRASRGRALGLYNAIAGFGGLIGTIAGALAYSMYGVTVTYIGAAVVVLVGAALLTPIPYHMFTVSSAARRRRFGTTRAVGPRALRFMRRVRGGKRRD
jgi:MFS family permease